ncbi:MAG: RING finger protein [Chlamydiota bacterium]
MSAVSFKITTLYNPTEICPICLFPLENAEVVAHDDPDGKKHPIHKTCVREWLKVHPICPSCKKNVNTKSLFSWKERTLQIIKEDLPYVLATIAAVAVIIARERSGDKTIIY